MHTQWVLCIYYPVRVGAGRVKRLSPSIYLCVTVCVCRQKTRLFVVLPLENRHEITLHRSASQFIFFERCLQSRTSLLSSAMAMVSNSCTAPRGYRTLR